MFQMHVYQDDRYIKWRASSGKSSSVNSSYLWSAPLYFFHTWRRSLLLLLPPLCRDVFCLPCREEETGRGTSNLSCSEIKPMWFSRRCFTGSFENWWWKHNPLMTTICSYRRPVVWGWRAWSPKRQGQCSSSPWTSITKLLRPIFDCKLRQFPVLPLRSETLAQKSVCTWDHFSRRIFARNWGPACWFVKFWRRPL